ncbi:MAG: hypothetical protein AAB527_02610, partial [Patescibacteria group bacterium]
VLTAVAEGRTLQAPGLLALIGGIDVVELTADEQQWAAVENRLTTASAVFRRVRDSGLETNANTMTDALVSVDAFLCLGREGAKVLAKATDGD